MDYTFNRGLQAKICKKLWEEYVASRQAMHEKSIGKDIGSNDGDFRFAKVFRVRDKDGKLVQHPAFGKMIVGDNCGRYKLVAPPIPE